MCSVYNYTVDLLCSRRDNIINKPADGTVVTQKGLEVYKKVKERSEQQCRVEAKVGSECLVSRKDCLGNKQTVRIDKNDMQLWMLQMPVPTSHVCPV